MIISGPRPYMMKAGRLFSVNPSSDIYRLSDLRGKKLAVQSTNKTGRDIFCIGRDEGFPKLGNLISLEKQGN